MDTNDSPKSHSTETHNEPGGVEPVSASSAPPGSLARPPRPPRRRRTPEERLALIDGLRRSGLDVATCCVSHSISVSALQNWTARLAAGGPSALEALERSGLSPYLTRNGIYDNPSSRVTEIKDGSLPLVLYDYAGVGQVVGTDYTEPEVIQRLYEASTYGDLDRFNRVVKSRWTKELSTNVDYYHVELTYDRNSNITSADDSVHAGFDVKYTMDDTDRLVRAEEGTLSSGSITSRTRDQQWTLNHTGNWKRDKVDLNGDADFVDTDEVNDTRSHNAVNELTARDTDSDSTNNYSLAFDAAGNQTDEGKDYEYVWDAFYRLRKVNRTDNQALVAEYRYNGLGFKIAEHVDTDTDGDVDANDKWFYDAFDERWRQVSRFRESDTSPKEEFVAHQAGASGRGGSSYIDLVICRYKDANTAWTSASDGVLEERLYYCQNQHADVVAIVGSDGTQKEQVRYSAYGVPFGLPGGDCDSDGDCDSADVAQVQAWIDAPAYAVRGDVDLDGDVDTTDRSTLESQFFGNSAGLCVVSLEFILNRRGIAGGLTATENCMAVEYRNRSHVSTLGRWRNRDPLEHVDGPSLYVSFTGNPATLVDPTGLHSQAIDPSWVTCPLTGLTSPLTDTPGSCLQYLGGVPGTPFFLPVLITEEYCIPLYPGCYLCIKATFIPWCVCNSTGNSDFANCVRSCLKCMINSTGTITEAQHAACFAACLPRLPPNPIPAGAIMFTIGKAIMECTVPGSMSFYKKGCVFEPGCVPTGTFTPGHRNPSTPTHGGGGGGGPSTGGRNVTSLSGCSEGKRYDPQPQVQ